MKYQLKSLNVEEIKTYRETHGTGLIETKRIFEDKKLNELKDEMLAHLNNQPTYEDLVEMIKFLVSRL